MKTCRKTVISENDYRKIHAFWKVTFKNAPQNHTSESQSLKTPREIDVLRREIMTAPSILQGFRSEFDHCLLQISPIPFPKDPYGSNATPRVRPPVPHRNRWKHAAKRWFQKMTIAKYMLFEKWPSKTHRKITLLNVKVSKCLVKLTSCSRKSWQLRLFSKVFGQNAITANRSRPSLPPSIPMVPMRLPGSALPIRIEIDENTPQNGDFRKWLSQITLLRKTRT